MFVSFVCHMAYRRNPRKASLHFSFSFSFFAKVLCVFQRVAPCIFLSWPTPLSPKHPLFGEQMLFFLGALFSPFFFALKKTLSLPDIKHKKSFIPPPSRRNKETLDAHSLEIFSLREIRTQDAVRFRSVVASVVAKRRNGESNYDDMPRQKTSLKPTAVLAAVLLLFKPGKEKGHHKNCSASENALHYFCRFG